MSTERTLAELISRVELLGVRLIKADVSTLMLNPQVVPPATMEMSNATHVLHRDESGFRVGAALRVRIVRDDSNDVDDETTNPLAQMDVTFELQYNLPDAATFSNQVLQEFARVNGTFNAWPYWREYVQTTAARMTLPPTILPVFRIGQLVPPSQDQPRSASEERPSIAAPAKPPTGRPARKQAKKKK